MNSAKGISLPLQAVFLSAFLKSYVSSICGHNNILFVIRSSQSNPVSNDPAKLGGSDETEKQKLNAPIKAGDGMRHGPRFKASG